MKLSLFIAFASIFLFCCSASKSISVSDRDGTSFEKAVVITEKTETAGVAAEYAWIKNHYRVYTVTGQSLTNYKKKPYDIINITTEDGKSVELYFDISSFFGKL